MARTVDLSLKKQAKQARSVATVSAIVEAATYILRDHGNAGLTANKVAERAGVNIASFYQYFPNKEALLFHIVKLNWELQLVKLMPILQRDVVNPAQKFKDFIREFFLIEAAEVDLRRALRVAAVELRDTEEFRELISKGADLTRDFIKEAVGESDGDLDFKVDFIVLLVTSFAERTTDEKPSDVSLLRQADLLSSMLIAQFAIPETCLNS